MGYIDFIYSIIDKLRKYLLYTNKKKSFYYHKMKLFDHIVFLQKINIKDKQIKTVNNWPKFKSI